MAAHPRAGQPAEPGDLVDVARLVTAYYAEHPDPGEPAQQVQFGTSGHRGSAFDRAFNDDHIAATTQAICDYRRANFIGGPLFLGKDTHALSEPAYATALEVLAANEVTVLVDPRDRYTPTPALSLAILMHNEGRRSTDTARADGIVVTPSHNPPRDGGFKYNPPDGGPAGSDITGWVQDRANDLLRAGMRGVMRVPLSRARAADSTQHYDFLTAYVEELPTALDLDAIRASGLKIGADPLGGASVDYWAAIAERHKLDLTVVNPLVDPTFRFMTLDTDGKIRMDCSSPNAMASLVDDDGPRRLAVRHRHRQRRRRRPARRRHTRRRPAQPQPLPRGGDRVPLPGARRLVPRRRDRQDARQLEHDRPGRRGPRPAARRGAGRLQVVRARPARRLDRLRRRGVGRRELPAPGRQGLDDRQGRAVAVPARVRDHRGHGFDTEPAVRRARGSLRRPDVRPCRRTRVARGEGRAGEAVGRPGEGDRTGG